MDENLLIKLFLIYDLYWLIPKIFIYLLHSIYLYKQLSISIKIINGIIKY